MCQTLAKAVPHLCAFKLSRDDGERISRAALADSERLCESGDTPARTNVSA